MSDSTTPAAERTPWDHVLLARHADRPHSADFIERLIEGFEEIHGDRSFGDDPAILAGFGTFRGEPLMVIAQEKGRDTKSRMKHNFGMPKPEGYRKAMRAMRLAEKFGRPVICFIDTPGAYPGIGAEEDITRPVSRPRAASEKSHCTV